MGDTETAGFPKSIFELIKATAVYVPVVIGFLLSVFGLAPEPYSITTSTLTLLIASLLLFGWHWPQLTRHAPAVSTSELLVVGEIKKSLPLWSRLIDPFRRSGFHTYSWPLFRRRLEGTIILSLLLFSCLQVGRNFGKIQNELLGLQDCYGSNKRDAVFVLIVDFAQSDNLPKIEIVEALHDFLTNNLDRESFKVCRSADPISVRIDAINLADKTHADVIIWGRRNIVYDVHIEVPRWDPAYLEVSSRPSEGTADFEFVQLETAHLGYLTEFTLSEILFEAGEVKAAQQRLQSALERAEADNLEKTNAQDLSEGYFLKGLLFDPGTELPSGSNPSPDVEKALQGYSRSVALNQQQYAALLHLGILHDRIGQRDEAFDDYTQLITAPESPLIAEAYINRSALQPTREAAEADLTEAIKINPADGYFFRGIARKYQWDDLRGAIEDFEAVVAYKPDDFFPYHELGMAQLEAGFCEDARQTYRKAIPTLDEESREMVISDLGELAEDFPGCEDTVEQIIKEVESAK